MLAGCRCPYVPVGPPNEVSPKVIITGEATVVIIRAAHADVVATTRDAVVVTVGLELVAIVAGSPDGALACANCELSAITNKIAATVRTIAATTNETGRVSFMIWLHYNGKASKGVMCG